MSFLFYADLPWLLPSTECWGKISILVIKYVMMTLRWPEIAFLLHNCMFRRKNERTGFHVTKSKMYPYKYILTHDFQELRLPWTWSWNFASQTSLHHRIPPDPSPSISLLPPTPKKESISMRMFKPLKVILDS